MKILVTGAGGFIGKNLVCRLRNKGFEDIFEYTRQSTEEDLKRYCAGCDFVFHLAGVNRPKEESEFEAGNAGLTRRLLSCLEEAGNTVPVVLSSSTQAESENAYGSSKRGAEEAVRAYGERNGIRVYIYRLPNVFGKWSRPEYNSAVATFCYQVARDLPIRVNDPEHPMKLVYIDDLTEEFAKLPEHPERETGPDGIVVPGFPVYETKLGRIAETIQSFGKQRETYGVPQLSDALTSKLYSTYLSFLPRDGFSYPLKMNCDERGSFTEFIRTPDRGQVSVNVARPGITKGQHWHDSKNEKFLVVQGKGLIRFRKVGETEIIDYHVSGEKLEAVEIPTGYTHCIINEGDTDLITVMWASEAFDPEKPDTYHEEV